MLDLPLSDLNITRFGSGANGLPSRFERRSYEYTGVEALPEGLATEVERRDSRLKRETEPGWRATIQGGGLIIAVVLVINVFLLVYAYIKQPPDNTPVSQSNRAIFAGDCSTANNVKTWTHVAINILGTLLLVTSGVTMQVLSAPTREEIDQAHSESTWMDIGLLSIRNLFRIPLTRSLLWAVLALTSIPLHLLYNSVIFSTISGNDTLSLMVTSDFSANSTWDQEHVNALINTTCSTANGAGVFGGYSDVNWDMYRSGASYNNIAGDMCQSDEVSAAVEQMRYALNATGLTQISSSDCLKAFQPTIVSNYRNVILVTTLTNQPQLIVDMTFTSLMSVPEWTCNSMDQSYKNTTDFMHACLGVPYLYAGRMIVLSRFPTEQSSVPISSPPQEGYFNIDHCLVQEVEGNCTVQVYTILMIVVIAANAVKLITVFYVARSLNFKPLVTVGDAVVEFMQHPDSRTRGSGPLEMTEVKKIAAKIRKQVLKRNLSLIAHNDTLLQGPEPIEKRFKSPRGDHEHVWVNKKRFLFNAASKRRWVIVQLICWGGVATAASMLALMGDNSTIVQAIHSGFGSISASYILAGDFNGVTAVLLANTPQIIISNIYVLYNGLLTSMLLTSEFMDFASNAKGMRVSPVRKGEQRGTYYLQLPYKYSLPLMILMILLHWLVSESFFLVNVDSYSIDGQLQQASMIDSVGYSAPAIVASSAIAAFIALLPIVLGFRRLPSGIPLVGNCSLAISAACHPAANEPENAVEQPLRYGVLNERGLTGRRRVGFTSMIEEVEPLESGTIYDCSRCSKAALLRPERLSCCFESWSKKLGGESSSSSSSSSTFSD